jgi:hypothetical protein
VYLGGFDNEVQAAKAHDIMAVKCRGVKTIVNFKLGVYEEALPYITSPQLARVSGWQFRLAVDLCVAATVAVFMADGCILLFRIYISGGHCVVCWRFEL